MDEEMLTKVELMVMKVIWGTEYEMSLSAIVEKVNKAFQKSWKSQTISTYLARLVRKRFLKMKYSGNKYTYEFLVTKNEYLRRDMADFANCWGNHSPTEFLAAIHEAEPMTSEQKKELREFVEGLV